MGIYVDVSSFNLMPEFVAATTSADTLTFEYELSAATETGAEKRGKLTHLRRNPSMLTAIKEVNSFVLSSSSKGAKRYRVVVEVEKTEDLYEKLGVNSIREYVEGLR